MAYLEFLRLWRDHKNGAWVGEWVDITRLAPLAFGNRTVIRANREPLLLNEPRPLDHLSDSTDAEELKSVLAEYLAPKLGKRSQGFLVEQDGRAYRLTRTSPAKQAKTDLPGSRQRANVDQIVKLCGDSFTQVFPPLIQHVGDVNAGLMLSQLRYWSQKQADAHGWVCKSAREWEAALGLSRKQQETARTKLISAGAIEEEMSDKRFPRYRLLPEALPELGERWVAFRPALFELFGDVRGVLLLSLGLYWVGRSRTEDGSFSRSREQWKADLGLGRCELESAVASLSGVWFTAEQPGTRPLHWIDGKELVRRLDERWRGTCAVSADLGNQQRTPCAESASLSAQIPPTSVQIHPTTCAESTDSSHVIEEQTKKDKSKRSSRARNAPAAVPEGANSGDAPAGRLSGESEVTLPRSFSRVVDAEPDWVHELLKEFLGRTPKVGEIEIIGIALEQLPRVSSDMLMEAAAQAKGFRRSAKALAVQMGKQANVFLRLDHSQQLPKATQYGEQEVTEPVPTQPPSIASSPQQVIYPSRTDMSLLKELEAALRDGHAALFERYGIPISVTFLQEQKALKGVVDALDSIWTEWSNGVRGKAILADVAKRSIMHTPYPREFACLDWRERYPLFRRLFGRETWWRDQDYRGNIAATLPPLLAPRAEGLP